MKRLIALWLAALMLAAQPVQAAVCVGFGQSSTCSTVEDSIGATDDTFGSGSTESFIGSKFTTDADWVTVCKISAKIYKNSSLTSDFVMEIRADNADLPSSTILATSETVANSVVGTDLAGTYVDFVFTIPQALSGSTSYWAMLKKLSPSTYALSWRFGNDSPEHVVRGDGDATYTDLTTSRAATMILYKQ